MMRDAEAESALIIRPFYISWLERSVKKSADPFLFMAKNKRLTKLKKMEKRKYVTSSERVACAEGAY